MNGLTGQLSRVIANDPKGGVDSYQRLKKIVLDATLLKWSHPGNGVAPFLTHRCSLLLKSEPSNRPQLRLPTLL